ncbi:MAG: AbrB/MazE/SpoVT family DNA-binding domain-containing protein [bacterium]|nr:AbrB/MazE/SpoVT family DNA-binding domain-containing protein [bacterium]
MKCHICKGEMEKIYGKMPIEKIDYEAYHCTKCGEEILTMDQMKELGQKYRQLRKAKQTSFAKWGNSIAILIPEEMVKELKIKPGTKAQITREKGMLKIIPA